MKARVLQNHEIDKDEWNALVYHSPQGSVFLDSGFLDAVLPGQWNGIMVEDGPDLLAVMPFYVASKMGLKYALQPIFTKYWGVAFKDMPFTNTYKEYSWKKKYLMAIIDALPSGLSAFSYNFHPAFDYPLPFYWKGYQIQAKYTYCLNTHQTAGEKVLKNYGSSLKTNIRRAEKNGVHVISDRSVENLLQILPESHKTGETIIHKTYYSKIQSIFDYGYSSGRCFALTALNKEDQPIASSLFLQDQNTIYALILAILKKERLSAASALIMHNAIMMAAEQNLKMDMAGSMLEPVEAFDRHFGAMPTPYLNISKKNLLVSLLGK